MSNGTNICIDTDGLSSCGACGNLLGDPFIFCPVCGHKIDRQETVKMTNLRRIKRMTVDELATFMNECGHDFPPYCDFCKAYDCDSNCLRCAREWLFEEVESND